MLTVAAVLSTAAIVAASVLIQQNITTTPTAVAPDIIFVAGDDYSTINTLGFADLTIGSSGSSATLVPKGVPGAASVALTDVLEISNQDATLPYNITLTRSAAPNAAVTGFTVTVRTTAGATITTWNAATTASSATFALAAATSYEIDVSLTIADGTAAGSLGSFTMQAALVPG